MATKIKICGITRIQDADNAVLAGVDAIGLVFYDKSPRHINSELAATIIKQLPPFVTAVGLFVNSSQDFIAQVLDITGPMLLQFHGNETPEQCEQLGLPYIKAVPVKSSEDIDVATTSFVNAKALLLDSHHQQLKGGTGTSFNWHVVQPQQEKKIILAGGINSTNVVTALQTVQPWAIDVSSGVESAPGLKDKQKMIDIVAKIKQYDYDNLH